MFVSKNCLFKSTLFCIPTATATTAGPSACEALSLSVKTVYSSPLCFVPTATTTTAAGPSACETMFVSKNCLFKSTLFCIPTATTTTARPSACEALSLSVRTVYSTTAAGPSACEALFVSKNCLFKSALFCTNSNNDSSRTEL